MRVLVKAQIPVAKGSETIKNGVLPRVIKNFLDEAKPESVIFTVEDGKRTMVAIMDLAKVEDMARLGEPLFMELEAALYITPGMGPQGLAAGLQAMG